MKSPRFSVIIPVRNRIAYLKDAVESVLSQEYQDFELLIVDNFSTDGAAEYLSALTDPRLRVISPPSLLAMSGNFEFALEQARGDWLTVIGSDDGLMPYFFEYADILLSRWGKEFEVIQGPRAYYFWPGLELLYGGSVVQYQASSNWTVIDSKEALYDLIYRDVEYFEFPQFYTGTLFSRALLEKIRKRHSNGKIFHSMSPDGNSVAVILLNTPRYLNVGVPLAWVGSSPKSNGAQATISEKKEKTEENNFLEFKKQNEAAGYLIPEQFEMIFDIAYSQFYFIEAIYSVAINNNYSWAQEFQDKHGRHRIFVCLYREYRRIKKKNLQQDTRFKRKIEAYERLFENLELSKEKLYFLHIVQSIVDFPFKMGAKISRKIQKIFVKFSSDVKYECRQQGVHEHLMSVNCKLKDGELGRRLAAVIKSYAGD